MKYYWQGGRLYSDKESLSITEAYAAMSRSKSIAKACWNILIPYRDYYARSDELDKKRILEGMETGYTNLKPTKFSSDESPRLLFPAWSVLY